MQLWLIYPLHQTMDLPAWDELNFYALPGIRLLSGSARLQSIEYGPLYSLLYAPVIAWLGLIDSIFAMRYLLTLAVTLLLFVFLLTTLRSWRAATALSLVWAVAQANIVISTMVFHLALVLLLAALTISRVSRLAALLFLLLGGFVRPEYFFLALCYGGYLLLRRLPPPFVARPQPTRRRAHSWPSVGLIIAQVALLAILVTRVSSWSFSAGRSWLAFQQHYAFAQVVSGRYNLDPWGDFPYIIARDLPGADSVGAVLRAHPGTVIGHVLSNLAALPGSLAQFILPIEQLRAPVLYGVLVPGAALIGALWAAGERARFREELRALLGRSGDVPALALLAPLTLLPNLLVSLRFPQYVMVLMPFLFFALGAWGVATIRAAQSHPSPVVAALGAMSARWVTPLVVAALLALLATQPRPFAVGERQEPRHIYEKIAALGPLMPQAPYAAYGGAIPSYLAYLCPNCRALFPLNQNSQIDLRADLERLQPGVVAIDSGLLTSPFFDPAALAVMDDPQWRGYAVADEMVYIRADLAVAPAQAGAARNFALFLPHNWRAWYHNRSLSDQQARHILNLPGHFWIYSDQGRRVRVRLTPYSDTRGFGGAEPPDSLPVRVNNLPATTAAVARDQITAIELELAPGYNQIWLGAQSASPELRIVPVEQAIVPEGPALSPIQLLTIEPLP